MRVNLSGDEVDIGGSERQRHWRMVEIWGAGGGVWEVGDRAGAKPRTLRQINWEAGLSSGDRKREWWCGQHRASFSRLRRINIGGSMLVPLD